MSDATDRRAYRRWLRLAPRRLREKHGSEMEELFADRLAAARRSGRLEVVRTWGHAGVDLLKARARWLTGPRFAGEGPGAAGDSSRSRLMTGSDLRYAARSLARQKLATALVVGMLALGIAATVAVFGLVDGLLLRPFPYPEPDRLVYVNEKAPRWDLEYVGINYPDFDHWRREQRLFEGLALYNGASFNASDGQNADRIDGAQVTHDFAGVLRVRPVLGRFFTPEEDRPKGPPVVVLGHGLWRERFGGDPEVLGRSFRLDGVPRTVVGVMPPEAEFPLRARLFVPLGGDPHQEGQSYSYESVGRLKAGVDAAEAEADLLRAQQAIWESRDKEKIVSPFVRPLREELVRNFRPAAGALAAAVGLLLLVACANVASLMLARSLTRRREMAIRVAVGASRWRLLSQLLAENLLLAVGGGVLGVLFGHWALRTLLAAIPDVIPRWAHFGLDARVAGFAVLVTGAAVVLFGAVPAAHAMRDDLRTAMAGVAAGSTATPRGRRTLRLLVGAEFALAALLLVCGGLLLQAFERVRRVDPGFDPQGVLTFGVYVPEARYPDDPSRLAFWESFTAKLAALPGVESVGAVTCAPFGGCHWGTFYTAEGQPPRAADEKNPVVLYRFASLDYARTLGLRLRSGRFFDARDGRAGSERVIVVNESFARQFFPGVADPVGRRVKESGSQEARWATVVGLVADVKHYGLEVPMRPGVYHPLPERPADALTLTLKTRGEPAALIASARALLRELDPDLAAFRVRTMEQAVRQSFTTRAAYSTLLAAFASLALALALGGTYGVTAYLATQRTREIGIRLALGAQKADIRRHVLRASLAVVGLGAGLGLLLSLAAARALSGLLFGVPPGDPLALAGALAVLSATALLANYWPAARAARVDPITTLRAE